MTIETEPARLTLPATALLAFAFAAFALAAPLPATAQMEGGQPPIAAEDLSTSQLESFAAAAVRVGEITDQLQAQAQGVEDQAELIRLQEQANMEMAAAVEDEGLTVDEYNMIFQVAQVDPEVNAMLLEMMQP
jgi:hypothetical protein